MTPYMKGMRVVATPVGSDSAHRFGLIRMGNFGMFKPSIKEKPFLSDSERSPVHLTIETFRDMIYQEFPL
jgi:hypothetical protein